MKKYVVMGGLVYRVSKAENVVRPTKLDLNKKTCRARGCYNQHCNEKYCCRQCAARTREYLKKGVT